MTVKSPHGSLHLPVHLGSLLVADVILLRGRGKDPGRDHTGPQHQGCSGRGQEKKQPEPAGHDGEGLREGSQDDHVLEVLRQSSLHVEVNTRGAGIAGLTHGPHELEAGNVEKGRDDEHHDVEGEVGVPKHGVGGKVEGIHPHNHVPVEHQSALILLHDLPGPPGPLLAFLLIKCFHLQISQEVNQTSNALYHLVL